MSLSQEQLQAFQNWATQKGIQTNCQCCGNPRGTLEHFVAGISIKGANVNTGVITPMVQVVCTNCGNIRFFSAVMCGIYRA